MMSAIIAQSLHTLVNILVWLILIRVIMSWIRPDPSGPAGETFYRIFAVVFELTEPLINPIRQLMPGGGTGIDFSPLILLFLLRAVQRMILQLL